jgi:hypothetical protein
VKQVSDRGVTGRPMEKSSFERMHLIDRQQNGPAMTTAALLLLSSTGRYIQCSFDPMFRSHHL